MKKTISAATKKRVAIRADYRCEYCLLREQASFYSFHIEHIRSLKHGGTNELDNLAYCCPDCNYYKGSDIGTFHQDNETIIRFFNPRKDNWHSHFQLDNGSIHGTSDIGKATVQIFKFNEVERLIFRNQLVVLELYP